MNIRRIVRRVRDHRHVNPALRYPFESLKRLGVRIPERIYRHIAYRGPFFVPTGPGQGFNLFSEGQAIENAVYWAGAEGYEPGSIAPWIEHARTARVVLDIGANSGMYALLAASVAPDVEVHAFEPVPRVRALLEKNCSLNPSFRIFVHDAAVGAETGHATLHDPGGAQVTSASLRSTFRTAWESTYTVPVVTVDDFVTSRQLHHVDLIKIDVEGFEEEVLDGMQRTVGEHRPAILLEYLARTPDRLAVRVERLAELGYECLQLTPGGAKAAPVGPAQFGKNVLLRPRARVPGS